MNKSHSKIRVGITMGDPSGIGPSIIFQALGILSGLAELTIIGDRRVFAKTHSTTAGTGQNYNFIDLNNVSQRKFSFGKIKAEYGKASIEYLDKALQLISNKQIDCLVTCPISKEAINLAGFFYSGHSEYLAKQTKTKDFVMMLLNKQLKISLVTRHIPIKEVPSQLSKDKLYKTIFMTHQFLKTIFLIKNPRIVVCGLNPHASDNGLIGNEEEQIISPVLKNLKRRIAHIEGPISSEMAIYRTRQKKYDCAIAMYHDQALIPLKLLGTKTGVNLTLGLPFVRTSPLHGTAFDIAGTNLADPSSLIAAIRLAVKCALNLRKD